jgi:O-antigen/teichoic acid export membrane protein
MVPLNDAGHKTNRALFFNAGSLVATFIVKSSFGYGYWWLAARQFAPEDVGVASAAVSAMTLLGTLCMLGLGTLLIRELPRHPGHEGALISAALLLVGIFGAFVGLIFALIVPSFSSNLLSLRATIFTILLFASGVGFATINLVFDQVLIGLLRGEIQLWRNLLFAGAKLAALAVVGFWLFQQGAVVIYLTWVLGDIFSLGALAVWKKKWIRHIVKPQWSLLRRLGGGALQHHLLNLLHMGPNMALPLLVTILISATMNAHFYIGFLIADVVYVVPLSLVTALYAVSSAQPQLLARKVRLTIGLALLVCVVADIVLFFGAKIVLELFGSGYAEQGLWSMRFLALAAFPFSIKELYLVISRIYDRMKYALIPMTASAIFEVIAAVIGARLGDISGLSLGWLIAVCIEATLMGIYVYRVLGTRYRNSFLKM